MSLSKQELAEAFEALTTIPCGTCGNDIQTVKQLIECRKHYVEDLRLANIEIERLRVVERTINTPQTEDFIEAVRNEAAHQLNRWGGEHDDRKAPEDWMWLLGWLISKAVQQPDKRLHHIVTSAAALAQWHRQESEPAKSGNYCHACCGIHEPGRCA